MSATIGIALGAMSTRRRLLLRSLIERVGGRLQPMWVLRDTPEAADVLLYDPAQRPPELPDRVLALPLLAPHEEAPDAGLYLHFPPAPAELARFLASAAQMLARPALLDEAAPLLALADAVLSLAQGRREAVGFGAADQRLALTAVDGHLRLHIHGDAAADVPMTPAELSRLRLLPSVSALVPGSMRAANDFVWALARALAAKQHSLVDTTVPLTMRGWPRAPEAVMNPAVTTRLAMRMTPGSASLVALQQCGDFSAEDVATLVNAGVLLGFVIAEWQPAAAHTVSETSRLKAGRGAWLGMRRMGAGEVARAS